MGIRRIRVSAFLLERILADGWSTACEPTQALDDPQILDVRFLYDSRVVELMVESASFAFEVADAQGMKHLGFDDYPEFAITFRRGRTDGAAPTGERFADDGATAPEDPDEQHGEVPGA